jgi:hypothetical protein
MISLDRLKVYPTKLATIKIVSSADMPAGNNLFHYTESDRWSMLFTDGKSNLLSKVIHSPVPSFAAKRLY